MFIWGGLEWAIEYYGGVALKSFLGISTGDKLLKKKKGQILLLVGNLLRSIFIQRTFTQF